jgi:hypothetical protein
MHLGGAANQIPLGDASELHIAMVGADLPADGVAVLLRLSVEVLIA